MNVSKGLLGKIVLCRFWNALIRVVNLMESVLKGLAVSVPGLSMGLIVGSIDVIPLNLRCVVLMAFVVGMRLFLMGFVNVIWGRKALLAHLTNDYTLYEE